MFKNLSRERQEDNIIPGNLSCTLKVAGARIGYAFANEEMVRIIDTVAEPFNANRVGLSGAITTLTKDQETYESKLQAITNERKNMLQELTDMGMTCIPTDTNFIFFETGFSAADAGEELLKRGIIVRPCTAWGYQEAIRVTVGTEYENKRFLEEFNKVIKESFDWKTRY